MLFYEFQQIALQFVRLEKDLCNMRLVAIVALCN